MEAQLVRKRDQTLDALLAPLSRYYNDPAMIEVRVSKPGLVILEKRGQAKASLTDEGLSQHTIEQCCQTLANARALPFDPETAPKLSTTLPEGHRFECAVGPSVQSGVSLAIRCKHPFTPSWDELGVSGDLLSYVKATMAQDRNLLISGGTNTGKTTLLNKLLTLLPQSRRIITVEDTPELDTGRFWDGAFLLAAREQSKRSSQLTYRELADHARRATPDSIIFGEISTSNAFAALDALSSGISGFICTIHAESAQLAIHRKFDQNITFAGHSMDDISSFLKELMDVVIQLKRGRDGFRRIWELYEPKNDRYLLKGGKVTGQMAQALAETKGTA